MLRCLALYSQVGRATQIAPLRPTFIHFNPLHVNINPFSYQKVIHNTFFEGDNACFDVIFP